MPLLHILESIFFIFLMFAWIWVVIRVVSDVFLSKDLSGLAKGIWMLFIIVIPWLGVMFYLIIRGKGMGERSHYRSGFIQSAAGSSIADELSKLAELRDKGVITDSEFNAQKAKLLS